MNFSLISLRTGRGIYFGRLVNDSLFYISDSMKNILLLSMFLTFYLTLLFITNIRANPATIVRNRIKRLRENLFEQLYTNKNGQERAKWILELEQRREEIRAELKRNLRLSHRAEDIINGIIDRSWDELLAVIKAGGETRVIAPPPESSVAQAEAKEAADEIEEIEELGEAEEAAGDDETAEYAEEIEEIEEVEEIEEAEEAEELEEITDDEEIEEAEVFEEEPAPVHVSGGLLSIASRISTIKETDDIEELEELDEPETLPPKRGLLFLSSSINSSDEEDEPDDYPSPPRKGLLTLASEIEFNREYPAGDLEGNGEDLNAELDIVSPFSSMFMTLDSNEE